MELRQIQQVYEEYVKRRTSPAEKEISSQAIVKPKKNKK